jgi:hypothetical protein
MSADGEIEVKVSADGADQAAEDLSDESAAGVGGGGGGDGEDGGLLSRGLKGGAVIGALLGLLDVLSPIAPVLEVIKALLSPITLILARLLQPFLRFMVTRVLPALMSFMDDVMPVVDRISSLLTEASSILRGFWGGVVRWLAQLPSKMWNLLQRGFSWIETQVGVAAQYLRTLPRRIWEFLQSLPRMIGNVISNRLPEIPTSPSGVVDTAVNTFAGGDGGGGGGGAGEFGQTIINLTGGLGAFVEQVQRDNNITLP